ncbi:MAG TPA: DNA polymerase III subunit alpha, partial [Shinella sp.]|nr:DNA polymerase III subunit alpha [Shinella sp.]
LEMPYGQVDKICKLVPNNPANPTPLSKAIEEEPKLQEEAEKEPVVARLLDIAQKIEGLYRHASTHAAGIVIGDRPLSQLVPMYRDPRSDMPVTQFNMKWVEQAGLVKFDFLGLKTLTVLKTAVDFIRKRDIEVQLESLPLDDPLTYEMLSRGETVGVFQVESAGMRKALIGMRPDCIEDIIALVALYRPGPMENIPVYNARKHGEEEIESIHPTIDHLLKETQGVIVYQEQVMQIAQVLSGYSLGEADLLRRAMGKKIKEEMDKQRARFVDGAVKNGVSKPQSDLIFDLLAKFANYGFNKSHAAAYAIVSYQTAYLKAHYPVEFLAASMTYDMSNTDKLNDFRQDAGRLGIEVIPPSVQTSFPHFETGENRIYYALAAIKGVGAAAVQHIVDVRGAAPFKSLEDFCVRIDPKFVNRRVFESLIVAGAFDCFGHDRAAMIAGLDRLLGAAQRAQENKTSGQGDIFGMGAATGPEVITLPAYTPWLASEKLHREFQVLGFYLSAHPLDTYAPILSKM